jgi:hypothetical protein
VSSSPQLKCFVFIPESGKRRNYICVR